MATRLRLMLAAVALLSSAGGVMAAAPKPAALESARVALRMRDYPTAVEKLRQSANAGGATSGARRECIMKWRARVAPVTPFHGPLQLL